MVLLSMAGFCRRASASFCAGEYNRVPVMMGALAEEYFGLQSGAAEISEADLDAFLTRSFGAGGLALKTGYQSLIERSPISAQKTISGDNGFTRTVRDWARLISGNHDTAYVYYFPARCRCFVCTCLPARSRWRRGARSLGAIIPESLPTYLIIWARSG